MTNRSVLVRLRADVSDFVGKTALAKEAVRDLHNEIDKSNDRTAWLAQGILALVPAVTQLGAGAVPVISGLATGLTVAVAAAGTAVLAFNGISDALDALNEYQLSPTEANLAKLNETMAKIGPEGQAFVEFLDSLGPAFQQLSNSARGGLFPGVIEGMESFMELAPQLNDIVREIGEGMGQLTSEAGEGLAGPKFEAFFEYLETRAKPILVDMGRTIGNFANGLLNMMVAFDPLTEDFSKGLLEMSRSFAEWSDGLSSSEGFQEFVSYVREAGPQALDFLGSMATLLIELAEAAAPVGAIMLPLLTDLLDVLGALANTPIGPLAIGFLSLTAAWGRLNAVMEITGSGVMAKATRGIRDNVSAARAAVPTFRQLGSAAAFAIVPTQALTASMESNSKKARETAASALNARGQVQAFGRSVGPVAAQVGLLAIAMSDLDDKAGLTNTTSLALAGSLGGKYGAAAGAAAGFTLDLKAAADEATEGLKGMDEALASGNIDAVTTRLAQMKKELEDFQSTDGLGDWFSDVAGDLFTGGVGEGITDIYTQQIAEAEAELARLKNAQQDVANDKSLYNSLQAETAALEANIQAMREKREEALRGLNAELDYKGSILDARDALKENGRTVDENTRAGQANLRALYNLASAWNQQDDATKNAAGAMRAARQNFINTAEAMGMSEERAKNLAKRLFEIPTKREIKISLDISTAAQRVAAIKAELASIKDEDVYVNVRRVNAGGFGPQAVSTGSDGATVPKTGLPYADRHLYMLADGEEVISNRYGQADAFRRDRDLGLIPGYADGGTTSKDGKRKPRPVGGLFIQDRTAALEEAIRRLTDTYETQGELVERDIASRDQWAERMANVAQATVSGFKTGLFDSSGNVWEKGAGGGAIFNLNNDIAGLQQRGSLQAQLAGLGLSGEAMAALLSEAQGPQGNAAIASMIASGQIGQYAALFDQRAALQNSVGAAAGQFAFGNQYADAAAKAGASLAVQQEMNVQLVDANARLDRMEQLLAENADRTAAGVGNHIAGPVRNAARKRNRKPGTPR